ncbi:MAG: hypothetical protein KGZ83_01560 [Sulfuricella sp.]|nr:hypothetical protein [Sulfuricella sp.]
MIVESFQPSLAHNNQQVPLGADMPHGEHAAKHPSPPTFWIHPDTSSGLTIATALGSSALALVSEIAVCAARFVATGEGTSIDLRCLKAMPGERDILANLLGKGEVFSVEDTRGHSEFQETLVPCVWWVRHRNSDDETVGELIEIGDISAVVTGDRGAVAPGLEALRSRLSVWRA